MELDRVERGERFACAEYTTVLTQHGTTVVPPGQPFPLAREAGEYRLTVAAATRYGALTPQPLHYIVR